MILASPLAGIEPSDGETEKAELDDMTSTCRKGRKQINTLKEKRAEQ